MLPNVFWIDAPDVGRLAVVSRPDPAFGLPQQMQALREAGRLLVAGPHPAIDSEDPGPAGFSGSLIIAEFGSLQEARDWAEADPYIQAGVYSQVDVKPFKRAF